MASSCLNTSALAFAVRNTGVNVSLLIDALSPLCPKPPPRIEVIANHYGTVLVGYVCGFLPWGFLVLIDFISDKWKTVRATRRAGYLHITASVLPMLIVFAYASLQAISGDYKEMMTAIIAVLITVYHLARTVWGLTQLHEFKEWCKHTFLCIRAYHIGYQNPQQETELNLDSLDDELFVNKDIVDNEFTGRDISVTFDWKYRTLQTLHADLCTIRWAGAFLCSQGHKFHSVPSAKLPRLLIAVLSRCTFLCQENELQSLYRLRVLQWTHLYGAFKSMLFDYFCDHDEPFVSFSFELENVVSSYPLPSIMNENYYTQRYYTQLNRKESRTDAVEVIMGCKLLGPENMQSIADRCNKLQKSFCCREEIIFAWTLLQNQVGIKEHVDFEDVHSFWKLMIIPVWSEKVNNFGLQASAHVDIQCALEIGNAMNDDEEFRNMQPIRGDEFENCSAVFENMTWIGGLSYILGISLDAVRTILGRWVSSQVEIEPCIWTPKIPSSEILFSPSTYLSRFTVIPGPFVAFDEERQPTEEETGTLMWSASTSSAILWECQYILHCKITETVDSELSSPSSPASMALFICSYPAILVKCENEQEAAANQDSSLHFSIRPTYAPQKIHVALTVNRDSNSASMKLVAESEDIKFQWEDWINSAMAIVKAHSHLSQHSRGQLGFQCERNLDIFQPAVLTRPMLLLDQPNIELPNLPENIKVWTGWPIFDARMCQFELDQLMQGFKNICDEGTDELFKNEQYRERRNAAEKTLQKIASWDLLL